MRRWGKHADWLEDPCPLCDAPAGQDCHDPYDTDDDK